MNITKNKVFDFVRKYLMYIVLLLIVIIFSSMNKSFLSAQNLINVVNQNAYLMICGVGVCIIMLSGAMDLSIGYQMSVSAVVMGTMGKAGFSTAAMIITGVLLCILLSTLNGVIYARLKIFPFIITLATQYIFFGISYLLSESKTFRDFDSAFKFIGGYKFDLVGLKIPLGVIIMIAAVCIGAFILNKTYFGRNIYALGSNFEAVALSGVSVAKMRILVFAVAGVFFALSTVTVIGRVGSSTSGTGVGAEFSVMAGALLGGIKMGGGGKMNNMVVGMLIIGILNNGMDLMNLNNYWQKIVMGVILLIAIVLDTLQTEAANKRAKTVAGMSIPDSEFPEESETD